MNPESKLKLQAYLDGELTASDAQEVAAWLSRDSEARALSDELTQISRLLETEEIEVKVPESREFYWSKIARAIERADKESDPQPAAAGYSWWMRIFAPAVGVALVLMTTLTLVRQSHSPARMAYPLEIETPLEDTSTISFHSPSAGMTVVWVQSDIY